MKFHRPTARLTGSSSVSLPMRSLQWFLEVDDLADERGSRPWRRQPLSALRSPQAFAPPVVLRVDEKNWREYHILNCCGVVITTNQKDSVYLPADDRRTYVAWSNLTKDEFDADYWTKMWKWYDAGGGGHVAAYLDRLDIASFNAKAPPRQTEVFWQIVQINLPPEGSELADAIDAIGIPPIPASWFRAMPFRIAKEFCPIPNYRSSGRRSTAWT
jgi:hypothetical protein